MARPAFRRTGLVGEGQVREGRVEGRVGARTLEGPKYCTVVSYLKEIQIVL